MLLSARRYFETIRYLSDRKLGGRLRYTFLTAITSALAKLRLTCIYKSFLDIQVGSLTRNPKFQCPRATESNGQIEPVSFLNEQFELCVPLDWNPPGRSLLWRFHLHYFNWAPRDPKKFVAPADDWLASTPVGGSPGWHPYPTSLRLVNWIRAFEQLGTVDANQTRLRSIARQAAHIESNLEEHLGGNHLIENYFALIVAGLFSRGPAAERWLHLGVAEFERELSQQVLPDGGHNERSPSYHFEMNLRCRETIQLLEENRRPVPDILRDIDRRMEIFFTSLLHPDGNIPLFHDSELITNRRLDRYRRLGSRSGVETSAAFPESGYFVFSSQDARLIADFGAPGSSENPGHQHAGIFSFELSIGDQRVIVDTGTPTYDPGADRDRLRGTAAHNTLTADHGDQFDVWKTFRVGKRAWLRELKHSSTTVEAIHDGYHDLGLIHRRRITTLSSGGWQIDDSLEPTTPAGVHSAASRFHLHPNIEARLQSQAVELAPTGWELVVVEGPQPAVEAATYSEAIGKSTPTTAIVLEASFRGTWHSQVVIRPKLP